MATVAITAGSGTQIRTISNSTVESGAHQQIFTLADAAGNVMPADPDGTLNATGEPSTLLLDSFDVSLANFVSGGTAPTIGNSAASFPASTTASAVSSLRTIGQFLLRAAAYLRFVQYVTLETGTVTNATRVWGAGTLQGSPTAAAPVLNGAVFQVDYLDGALYAVTYRNGTATKVATLTRPTDGAQHRYDVWYRQSMIYWLIDGVVVAKQAAPSLGVWQSPYWIAAQINHTTAPSASPVLAIAGVSIADTAGNSKTLSDGALPYLQQTVKAASTAVASTDFAAAVGLHPSSPLPAGTNALGSVTLGAGTITNALGRVALFDGTTVVPVKAASTAAAATDAALVTAMSPNSPLPTGSNVVGAASIGSTTKISSFATSTGTNAATQLKASAGDLQAMVVYNGATSTQYLKLFNATAVTLGTTAAVMDIPIAAGATWAPPLGPNGMRFATGIAYAITGAAGTANNTANAAGVQVMATAV